MNKLYTLSIGAMLLLTGVRTVSAQPEIVRPSYEVHALKQAPQLDGQVETDPAWQGLPRVTEFNVLHGPIGELEGTEFLVGVTEDALYLAIICYEPDVANLKMESPDNTPGICGDDSVEVFIHPDGFEQYFHLMINAKGSRWNGRSLDSADLPLGPWQVAVFRENRYWSIEAEIPFAWLGITPEKGEAWGFDIGRNIIGGPHRQNPCWGPHRGGFHEPDRFGILNFLDSVASPEAMAARKLSLQSDIESALEESERLGQLALDSAGRSDDLSTQIQAALDTKAQLQEQASLADQLEIDELKSLLEQARQLEHRLDALAARALAANLCTTP
jgi:hypothetical protein